MIFGYKGDVEVLTLRKTRVTKERVKEREGEEVDVYNWEVVPVRLDQIKEDEYVLLYCMMNDTNLQEGSGVYRLQRRDGKRCIGKRNSNLRM